VLVRTTPLTASDIAVIRGWLVPTLTASPGYTHIQLVEDFAQRPFGEPILVRYIEQAHRDSREYFERAFVSTLDPRGIARTALTNYPRKIEEVVRTGLFGEILAGLVAEVYGSQNAWFVPAFCFRCHDDPFKALMKSYETGDSLRRSPGRLGDDCLAFSIETDGETISQVLECEAKCTWTHDDRLIAHGHTQLSESSELRLELHKVIQVLHDHGSPESISWELAVMAFRDTRNSLVNRKVDMLVYTHGTKARSGTRMNPRSKHANHKAARALVAVELHVEALRTKIAELYEAAYP